MRRASPRRKILAIAAPLTALLLAAAIVLPTGFAVRAPGPTADTLGFLPTQTTEDAIALVTITGTETYPVSGQLLMTTVAVSGGPIGAVYPLDVLRGWLSSARAVLPVEALFAPDITAAEQAEQSAAQMISSKEAATAAALTELDFEIPVTLTVVGTPADSLATDVVEDGDILLTLNDQEFGSHAELLDLLSEIEPGTTVTLHVIRDGEPTDLQITTGAADTEDGGQRAALGVFVGSDFEFPIDVDIQIENVGGPSAGMMFALAIIDRLTEADELAGVTVAGTGTVDVVGNIGPIGGIEQKMSGALRDGANWFLAPAANCNEVIGSIPAGMRVVRVETLHEARGAIEAIGAGTADSLPSCEVA